jgi:hypothetical protein
MTSVLSKCDILARSITNRMTKASPKSIPEKLHLRPGQVLAVIDSPEGFEPMLGPLPHGCRMERTMHPQASVVLVFVHLKVELERRLSELKGQLGASAALWVIYPKGTSGMDTDLNRDIIWTKARTFGMDAVSNFAVDDVWSALRLKIVPVPP